MPQPLDSAIKTSAARLDSYIELHRGHSDISLHDHIAKRRSERAIHASSFGLIYLDTNAWKCVADYRQHKASLTPAMKSFGESIERISQTRRFAFPIGAPTFLELDSMTDPATRETLTQLVDELSQGLCIAPVQDRIGLELQKIRTNTLEDPEGLESFLCSPIELFGIPAMTAGPHEAYVDTVTFNKAFFDALSELPFSTQLTITESAPGPKWDNSRGITELNAGKADHQSEIVNLNTGIFVELKGCIEAWSKGEGLALSQQDIGTYAITAQYHWHTTPSSRALPVLRVLSSVYGLMRFDPLRRYTNGDPNDFMVAASALPVATALFTDKRLANLLSDKRIGLTQFSNCVVISGFEKMSEYLDQQL